MKSMLLAPVLVPLQVLSTTATTMQPSVRLVVRAITRPLAPQSAQHVAQASMPISASLASSVLAARIVWVAPVPAQHVTMARSAALEPPPASLAPPEGCSPHTAPAPPATVLPTLTAV